MQIEHNTKKISFSFIVEMQPTFNAVKDTKKNQPMPHFYTYTFFVHLFYPYICARPPCFMHPMQPYLNALQKYNFFSELPNFDARSV